MKVGCFAREDRTAMARVVVCFSRGHALCPRLVSYWSVSAVGSEAEKHRAAGPPISEHRNAVFICLTHCRRNLRGIGPSHASSPGMCQPEFSNKAASYARTLEFHFELVVTPPEAGCPVNQLEDCHA